MMGELLDSFLTLHFPQATETFFVIVENDSHLTMKERVDRFAAQMPDRHVDLVLEPDAGIPIARNTAVRTALSKGADAILFVDDDERVTPDWLAKMVARYRTSDLLLVGGPVEARFEGAARTRWIALLRQGIARRYRNKSAKSDALARRGRENRITIATNNWLADATLFTVHGLGFDPSLRFTGGSDAEFSHQVRKRGLPSGWAEDATVIETIPDERVSFRYQFRRGMEQSRNSLGLNLRRRGWLHVALSTAAIAVFRLFGLAVLVIGLPVTQGSGLVALARNAGWITGRVTGVFGAQSELYRKTTGY